jgi:hypothetical protein
MRQMHQTTGQQRLGTCGRIRIKTSRFLGGEQRVELYPLAARPNHSGQKEIEGHGTRRTQLGSRPIVTDLSHNTQPEAGYALEFPSGAFREPGLVSHR